MSKIIEYPKELPPMTPEEKEESQRIIAEAKAAGHPLANAAGILPDDDLTREWLQAIREYRQQVEDDPNAW